MKYYLLLAGLVCFALTAHAQTVYTLKADSVKITNCDSAELILANHTQGVSGFLYNTGNGRTIFKRGVVRLNDSLFQIGADTLKIPPPNNNFWSLLGNTGIDPTSQYIGTNDNNPLIVKTYGSEAMRIFSNGNVGIHTGPTDNNFQFQVNGNLSASGTNDMIGNLEVLSGANASISETGIRIDALGYTPFIFQGSGHSGKDMFIFNDDYGAGARVFSLDQAIVRITSGFSTSNRDNNNASVLALNPTYNSPQAMIIRGIYYNPTIDSLVSGTRHIAIETVSGDVLLGTTSGYTGIGTNLPTAQLHTTGSVRFAGLTDLDTLSRVIVCDASGNLYYRNASSLAANDPIRSSLAVNGTITAKKLRLSSSNWPDYVFDSSYRLMPLQELRQYIISNGHLPDVTPANDAEKNGVDVGENQQILLKKIEEMTLYELEQDKRLQKQDQRITEQDKELELLKGRIELLEKLMEQHTK